MTRSMSHTGLGLGEGPYIKRALVTILSVLPLPTAPLTAPVHGPREVYGRPHPSDAFSEKLLGRPPLLV